MFLLAVRYSMLFKILLPVFLQYLPDRIHKLLKTLEIIKKFPMRLSKPFLIKIQMGSMETKNLLKDHLNHNRVL